MKTRRASLLFPFSYFIFLALAGALLGLPSSLRAERIAIATPSRGLFEFPVVVANLIDALTPPQDQMPSLPLMQPWPCMMSATVPGLYA